MKTKIAQIMSRPVVTCRPEDSLNHAAKLMWDHDFGAIPVVDDDDRVVGMITDRDIAMAAYMQGQPLFFCTVDTAMATDVVGCEEDATVEEAEKIMRRRRVRRIPVLDADGRAVGLLALSDIVREVAGNEKKTAAMKGAIQTMATICEPRGTALQAVRREHETRTSM